MKYYVYVLESLKDKKHYTGISSNISRRFKEHNSGRTKSTQGRIPFQLIYKEECLNRQEARNREKYFKSGAGRKFLKEKVL